MKLNKLGQIMFCPEKDLKMTKLLYAAVAVILIGLFLFALGCSDKGSEEQLITLKVSGMTCNHCVGNVTNALQTVEGVDTAVVDLENDMATVHFKDSTPSTEAMIAAIEKAGYKAEILSE